MKLARKHAKHGRTVIELAQNHEEYASAMLGRRKFAFDSREPEPNCYCNVRIVAVTDGF